MRRKVRISPKRLVRDYKVMVKMAKKLADSRSDVKKLELRIATISRKSDLGEGAIDDLEDIFGHLTKAQKELDRARRKFELI